MSWEKLSSKIVYDNPWITVFEDKVTNPGGGSSDYGVVHFKNTAVAILPLDHQAIPGLSGKSATRWASIPGNCRWAGHLVMKNRLLQPGAS